MDSQDSAPSRRTEGPEDVAKALGPIKQMRVYPLSKAATAPEQRRLLPGVTGEVLLLLLPID